MSRKIGEFGESYDSYHSTFYIRDNDTELQIRVGPVYDSETEKRKVGIWIENELDVLACISKETWNAFVKHVEEKYIKWEKELNG